MTHRCRCWTALAGGFGVTLPGTEKRVTSRVAQGGRVVGNPGLADQHCQAVRHHSADLFGRRARSHRLRLFRQAAALLSAPRRCLYWGWLRMRAKATHKLDDMVEGLQSWACNVGRFRLFRTAAVVDRAAAAGHSYRARIGRSVGCAGACRGRWRRPGRA